MRVRLPPAIVQLRRAQLALVLAVLLPTVMMTVLGIVLLVIGESARIVIGVLVLVLCLTGLVGYILGSLFVGKGASLARIQNDFLSGVSHELRTPLTSMNLLLTSLSDDRLAANERGQVVKLLAGETARLDGLAARLIELSKVELGAYALRFETIDVSQLVEGAVAAFHAATQTAPTEIVIEVPSTLTLVGDRQTLERALVNLLINAWKYSDEPRRIAVRAGQRGRLVELAVSDNGIGVGHAERAELFDPFVRGQQAHERDAPGAGLGLAFVRAIVRAHRGKIHVASTPGQGSTFTLRLPQRQRGRHA